MTTIEETFAVLCDVNRRGGIIGHDSSHDEPVRPCPACENVRAAMLAVLDKAVVGARYTPNSKAKWIVELRQEIQELGK